MSNTDGHRAEILRVDFDFARREQFIEGCLDLINEAQAVFAEHPGLTERDVAVLSLDIPVSHKYSCLARNMLDEGEDVPLARRLSERCLIAGVIVHERLRQAREWLGYYGTFNAVVRAEELADFPSLNVRREILPQIYDPMVARTFPIHVQCALEMSDQVFLMVKGREKHLRAHCN